MTLDNSPLSDVSSDDTSRRTIAKARCLLLVGVCRQELCGVAGLILGCGLFRCCMSLCACFASGLIAARFEIVFVGALCVTDALREAMAGVVGQVRIFTIL